MKLSWLLAATVALLVSACGGTVETSGSAGSGNSAGSSGSGGAAGSAGNGGSAGASDCSALTGEVAKPVAIHVENKTAASVFIGDTCYIGGPTGVRVDDERVLDDWFEYSCDDVLACKSQGLDCLGGTDIELAAGATFDATWSGHFLDKPSSMDVPQDCIKGCQISDFLGFCFRKVAAKPGPHVLKVEYATMMGGDYMSIEIPFNLPATDVTATIQ